MRSTTLQHRSTSLARYIAYIATAMHFALRKAAVVATQSKQQLACIAEAINHSAWFFTLLRALRHLVLISTTLQSLLSAETLHTHVYTAELTLVKRSRTLVNWTYYADLLMLLWM
jgi:hypothetical protein